MKAVIYTQYGSPDVLKMTDLEKPTPQDDDVLVKVHAAGINAADQLFLTGTPLLTRFMSGMFKPTNPILGADIAGTVEAVGKNITQFKVGDAVFGELPTSRRGGFVEYVCAPETSFVLKPTNCSFEEAAAVPMAAVTALRGLRNTGQLQAGQKVLINGASGGVGSFAVQIAKAFGAEVTAVCSTRNVENMRALGADHVIDYTREDFTKNGQQYDLILAANGYRTLSEYKRALTPKGMYVMTGGTMRQIFEAMLLGPLMSMRGDNKMVNVMSTPNTTDLGIIKELLETGKVKPVIDKCFPLSKVADAFRYLLNEHAKGKVVVSVASL